MYVKIADMIFQLVNKKGKVAKSCDRLYSKGFIVKKPKRRPDIVFNIYQVKRLPGFGFKRRLFDARRKSVKNWRIYEYEKGYILETFDPGNLKKNRVAFISNDLTGVDLYMKLQTKSRSKGWSAGTVLRPVGELLAVNLLCGKNGALVHAMGMVYKGKAILFVGKSSAGKTTQARIWNDIPGVKVLNDDRVIIRRRGEGYWAFGTPWAGEFKDCCAGGAPISDIFLIRHSRENRVSQKADAGLAKKFLLEVFTSFWSQGRLTFYLNFVADVLGHCKCRMLDIEKGKDIVGFIKKLV